MFIRNNTSCPSCGECSTFDLFNAGGPIRHNPGLFREAYIGLMLECIGCEQVFTVRVDAVQLLRIIARARTILNKSVNGGTSWCHYVDGVHDPLVYEHSEQDWKDLLHWVSRSGFCRGQADPWLLDNPALVAFIGLILELSEGSEYGPDYDIIVIGREDAPDGQPLAS